MTRLTDGAELFKCSFCGKSQKQVRKLIGDSDVCICDECIELCNEIIEEELGEESTETFSTPLPTPREVKELLDSWVIGQDRVRHTLSVTVHNHYKHVRSRGVGSEEDMLGTKSNILLLGPTGTGKTHLARSFARLLHVPFVIVDATALTEAGYVDGGMENILLRLIQEADSDIKKAERGIIYVGEVDRIGRKGESASITRDVSGRGVQQALLRIIEGTIASVPPQGGRKYPHQQFLEIDTSGILFITTGVLADIEDIVKVRIGQRPAGFGSDLESKTEMGGLYKAITPEDPHRFGMIPEFIGRLSILASTKELAREDLVRVLVKPKNSLLRQYQRLFELGGIDLEFTHEALLAVAALADERKTEARDLSSVVERALSGLMFGLPSRDDVTRVVITRGYIEGTGEPRSYAQRGDDICSA